MDNILGAFTEVIRAVNTPLAAIALFSLILFVVGYSFFKESHVSAKLVVFFVLVFLVIGAVLLFYNTSSEQSRVVPEQVSEIPERSKVISSDQSSTFSDYDEPRYEVIDEFERQGYPSGYGILTCGCHGFNPPSQVPEQSCDSGYARLNPCPNFYCPTGGIAYAYVCM